MDRVAVKREQAVCVARGPDYKLPRSNAPKSALAQGSGGGNRSWFGGGGASSSPSPPRDGSPSKRGASASSSPSTSPERSSSWFGYRDGVAKKAPSTQKATDQLKRDVERKPLAN
jgi:hypothetical protein